jgi:hypothetical protein
MPLKIRKPPCGGNRSKSGKPIAYISILEHFGAFVNVLWITQKSRLILEKI